MSALSRTGEREDKHDKLCSTFISLRLWENLLRCKLQDTDCPQIRFSFDKSTVSISVQGLLMAEMKAEKESKQAFGDNHMLIGSYGAYTF